MTSVSVSVGHIILTPTQPVGSGRPQRESNPEPPHQESRALPTELPRLRNSQLLCCTLMHTQCMRLKLPVGWEVGQAQIDSDAPAMGLTTGPCVFRCKSGVHVIVNSACLRHRLRPELLFFVGSKLKRMSETKMPK